MRQKIEIPPSDDLNEWNPGGETDGNGHRSMQTITIPPEHQENSCYQTTALEKRECFDVADVNVYLKEGLPDKDKYVVVNANTPTWKLTFHPAQHNITVYGIGNEQKWVCHKRGENRDCEWIWESVERFLGLISLFGGRSATIGYYDETHRIESDHMEDGCTFRINSRHVAGGAGPGDIHAYWIYNLCEPIKHVDVTWQDNCAILEAATDLPN